MIRLAGVALLIVGVVAIGTSWWWLSKVLSPTVPVPDDGDEERPDSGADEQYPEDLAADRSRERELRAIADEYGLTLISPVGLMTAEDILALRLNLAELVDHCAQRVDAIIDDFAPGWWEEQPAVELPSFGAVHALIDDTSEFAAVA